MNATVLNGLERKFMGEALGGVSEWSDAPERARAAGEDGEADTAAAAAAARAAASAPPAPAPAPIRARGRGHNTGPKGVKADYDDAMLAEELQRKRDNMQHRANIERIALGVYSDTPSVSLSSDAARERDESAQRRAQREAGLLDADDGVAAAGGGAREDESHTSGGDDDDDGEADFFAAYRARRREQMQRESALPSFGAVGIVSPPQFLRELKACDARAFVVVHLHEDAIAASRRLAGCLDEVADRKPYVRFIRMTASEADPGLDPDVLPVLSLYRAGELVDAVLCVGAELGASFAPEDVERLLAAHGCVL